MGMSMDSFRRCTPGEFRAVYDSWFSHQEMMFHHDWVVGRFVAAIAVQPYCNTSIKPTELFPFPWEKDNGDGDAVPKGTSSKETMEKLWAKWQRIKSLHGGSNYERPHDGTNDQGLSR